MEILYSFRKKWLWKIYIGKTSIGNSEGKSGEILVDGKNLTDNLYEVRKNIGMVFQNPDEQIVSEG